MSQRPALYPRGVTLIEMLFIVGAIALVGVGFMVFQSDTFTLSNLIQSNSASQQDARRFLKSFLAEARAASPSSTGAFPIAAAAPTSLTFFSDIDSDGLRERVRYELSGTTLIRGVVVPSGNPLSYNPANEVVGTVIRDVWNGASPVFEYYSGLFDGSGTPMTQPVDVAAVRLIKVTLVLDRDPNRPPAPTTIVSQVAIRNLKENL